MVAVGCSSTTRCCACDHIGFPLNQPCNGSIDQHSDNSGPFHTVNRCRDSWQITIREGLILRNCSLQLCVESWSFQKKRSQGLNFELVNAMNYTYDICNSRPPAVVLIYSDQAECNYIEIFVHTLTLLVGMDKLNVSSYFRPNKKHYSS